MCCSSRPRKLRRDGRGRCYVYVISLCRRRSRSFVRSLVTAACHWCTGRRRLRCCTLVCVCVCMRVLAVRIVASLSGGLFACRSIRETWLKVRVVFAINVRRRHRCRGRRRSRGHRHLRQHADAGGAHNLVTQHTRVMLCDADDDQRCPKRNFKRNIKRNIVQEWYYVFSFPIRILPPEIFKLNFFSTLQFSEHWEYMCMTTHHDLYVCVCNPIS